MNGTVNVLCYRSKTLANGEHPLMVCISKDGKRKYKSIGVSVLPEHWDFEKNKPKRNCPNKELITKLVNNQIEEYSEHILELKATNKEYSASKLIEKVNGVSSKCTVGELFERHIDQLQRERRLKYASTYKELRNSLLDFNKHLDIYFSDIDINWLKNLLFHFCRTFIFASPKTNISR